MIGCIYHEADLDSVAVVICFHFSNFEPSETTSE